MTCASSSGVDTGLLGSFYTALSVIIVYHLFALQQWQQDVTTAESACNLAKSTAVGDMARQRAITQCELIEKRFPWVQIVILGLAVASLTVVAVVAALELEHPSPVFTVLPTATLALVFVSATAATRVLGARRLRLAQAGVA